MSSGVCLSIYCRSVFRHTKLIAYCIEPNTGVRNRLCLGPSTSSFSHGTQAAIEIRSEIQACGYSNSVHYTVLLLQQPYIVSNGFTFLGERSCSFLDWDTLSPLT